MPNVCYSMANCTLSGIFFSHCSCGTKGTCTQKAEFETTPDVLNIQLPLFTENLRKLKVKRTIPDILTVTQHNKVIACPCSLLSQTTSACHHHFAESSPIISWDANLGNEQFETLNTVIYLFHRKCHTIGAYLQSHTGGSPC